MIDRLIRKGFGTEELPPHIRALMPPEGDAVCFGHVEQMMRASGGQFYRPPLLLTATNLSRRKLEVISSIDASYRRTPIAAAVRASAGFPIFFLPREFGEGLNKEWFVDGGVISNFPLWTFSDAFREQIAASEFYSPLAGRPSIRVGLRVIDDVVAPPDLTNPEEFFAALIGMLTGTARNQLEDILAAGAARSIIVKQPASMTEGPGVLAIGDVDDVKIKKMVDLGYEAAADELKRNGARGIYSTNRDLGRLMKDRLQSLVDECTLIIGEAAEPKFRANIFIPVRNKLKTIVSVNMDGDPDDMLEFFGRDVAAA